MYNPYWTDPPNETAYNKIDGEYGNPPKLFGALYLTATLAIAAAQARHQHVGRAINLFDIKPESRPLLASFEVSQTAVVDAVSESGVKALKLPARFPCDVPRASCQTIAKRAYRAGIAGVAARSNAEATVKRYAGEELALFDSHQLPPITQSGLAFALWYPDPIPD